MCDGSYIPNMVVNGVRSPSVMNLWTVAQLRYLSNSSIVAIQSFMLVQGFSGTSESDASRAKEEAQRILAWREEHAEEIREAQSEVDSLLERTSELIEEITVLASRVPDGSNEFLALRDSLRNLDSEIRRRVREIVYDPEARKKFVNKWTKTLGIIAVAVAGLYDLLTITAWDGMDCAGNSEDYYDPYHAITIGHASSFQNAPVDIHTIAQRERNRVIERMRAEGQLSYRLQGRCIRL